MVNKIMNSYKQHKEIIEKIMSNSLFVFILGMCIGAFFFLNMYGAKRLDPQTVDWLMIGSGDITKQYLGWCAYRVSPWTFPLCLTDMLSYPITYSIMFADSIPIYAVFFKILSPILPSTFQYIGIFGLITFMLQGAFGALLMRKLNLSLLPSLISAAIFCFTVPIMHRMFGHTALASQWVILAALCIWFSDDYLVKKKTIYLWCILAFVSVGLHLYLLIMVLVVLFGYCVSLVIKRVKLRKILSVLFVPICISIFAVYTFGGFVGDSDMNRGLPNLYVSNLADMLDSDGWSNLGWYNLYDRSDGSYEGTAYLGLGIIILLVISSLYFVVFYGIPYIIKYIKQLTIKNGKALKLRLLITQHPNAFSLGIVIFLGILLGLGSEVWLLGWRLFKYPLPNSILQIWGIFRATGRFTWIALYVITALAIAFSAKYIKYVGKYILIIILVIQFCDLNPFSRFSHNTPQYTSPLSNAIWSEIAGFKHIYWDTPIYEETKPAIYAIANYAFSNNMSINNFDFGPPPNNMPYPLEISSDTLYLINKIYNEDYFESHYFGDMYRIDGVVVSATNDTNGNLFEVMENYPEYKIEQFVD